MALVGGTDFVTSDSSDAGLDLTPTDYTSVPYVSVDGGGSANPAGVISAIGTSAAEIAGAVQGNVGVVGAALGKPVVATPQGTAVGGASPLAGIGFGSNGLLLLVLVGIVLVVALR